MKNHKTSIIFFSFLLLLDIFFWSQIVLSRVSEASFTMLDVGQGDSSLVELPSGAVIMTDAGPTRATTRSLDKVSLPSAKYIDLAVITHPQLDHYGGFSDILDHYNIGAFLVTGRVPDKDSSAWDTLIQKIKSKNIPIVLVSRGDVVRQGSSSIDILSPDPIFKESGELNDTGIVEYVTMASSSILLTADIGQDVESYLLSNDHVQADILKVAHHGSQYSSGENFLSTLHPKLAVIGVGENHYGHPTKAALARLGRVVGSNIFRTDKNGNIKIVITNGKLQVFTER